MTSQYETNLWSTHVNIVWLAKPIRCCVHWRTQVFKIQGFVCKRFLPSFLPLPLPAPLFFGSRFISCAAKTAGYLSLGIIVCCCSSFPSFRCFPLCSAYPRHIRAACVASGGGEERGRKNYPPFTPPPNPVRRLIAGYVHALCEYLKQDIGQENP